MALADSIVSNVVQAEEPGLAVFDGGSYSRGPMQLGVTPYTCAPFVPLGNQCGNAGFWDGYVLRCCTAC